MCSPRSECSTGRVVELPGLGTRAVTSASNHLRLTVEIVQGATIGVILSLLTACDRIPPDVPGVTRADSAGVQVITSGARDTALAWTFEEVGVLQDSAGAPYLFTNVLGTHVLTDRAGRAYVLTRDPAIVRFGREGREELTLGRRGGGPGEFQFPIAIGAQGDTVWAYDAAKRALVRFNPDLSSAGDRRLDGALAEAQLLSFRPGGLWFRRTDLVGDTLQVTGVYADTAGSAPLRRAATRLGGAVDFGCIGVPSAAALFAPQVAMHAAGPRLLVNDQPGYELWLYEGPRPIASIRRPLPPRAPTAADVRLLYPDGMRIGVPGRAPCVVPVEELVAKQGLSAQMPFVFDVVLLADATMWALRTPRTAEPVVDVFGSDGVYAGTMRERGLPLGRYPNGDLLFARADAESGGTVLVRVKVKR